MVRKKKVEFGDFQTPQDLTADVSRFLKIIFSDPDIIVEPTCGLGSFIKSCMSDWGEKSSYYGFDINANYIKNLEKYFTKYDNCNFKVSDFFKSDWKAFFRARRNEKILVIGNPPWVTNAALGLLNSNNLPQKSNFQGLGGFAAKTGKANFDIAEWILIKLLESLQGTVSCLSMLCKTATARKVLKHAWVNQWNIHNSSLHLINAKKHFDVAVDACLLITFTTSETRTNDAWIYKDLSFDNKICRFGLIGKELISNIDDYKKYFQIDGISYYTWRSGLKHDAAKVMELTKIDDIYINAFGEHVDIEEDYVYPLLKSSDIGNKRLIPHKFVIVTQHNVGDDTSKIKFKAPKTWSYLERYSNILDNRKSIIYQKRPRFSVFGVGNYSFTSWKVAISGLYKNISFSAVGNINNKPIMVDDTCYFIPCDSEDEAQFISNLLNSEPCINFMKSLVFFDAKRPVNIDILSRLDIKKIAEMNDQVETVLKYLPYAQNSTTSQQLLVYEKENEYQTNG